jgi:hypothetical protein
MPAGTNLVGVRLLPLPDAFEQFLASGMPLANEWQAAIRRVFPDTPPLVSVAQNVIVIRTLEWLVGRRARKLLNDEPRPALHVGDPAAVAQALYDVSVALLTSPTRLTDEHMVFE